MWKKIKWDYVAAIVVSIPVFAYLVFGIIAVGCAERYREIEFYGIVVRTTVKMHPWCIRSKENCPTPMYISAKDQCLKLDPETAADEVKTFLNHARIDYEEQYTLDRFGADYYIIADCFQFAYRHGKLWVYTILPDEKIIDGVRIGTSPQTFFSLPLEFSDIEKMFGHDYKVYERCFK